MLQDKDMSLTGLLASQHEPQFLDCLQLSKSLQMLHLQRATVMIADKIRDAEHLTNRWSVEKEQEIAACITPRKARPSWQSTRPSKKHEKKEESPGQRRRLLVQQIVQSKAGGPFLPLYKQ
ncbi:hypothetical protein HO173_004416 [Letharia columbiana]|uniref:Uncharacterized protein n=1 Tax=Letharia columbiana TaxID=112416 RepID=A0A8H6L6P5_9LECA|nr:uncharacterized protein HO173_004416 [Letharia columbiana]KAF6237526.1 hypothetical protein HO173_004416 [Letharia columbiana]